MVPDLRTHYCVGAGLECGEVSVRNQIVIALEGTTAREEMVLKNDDG